MEKHAADIEKQMVNLYRSLSERDRRRYAAVEVAKLGHGGTAYIAELFGCDPDTVRRGRGDVGDLPEDAAAGRGRKRGGPQASWHRTAGTGRRAARPD